MNLTLQESLEKHKKADTFIAMLQIASFPSRPPRSPFHLAQINHVDRFPLARHSQAQSRSTTSTFFLSLDIVRLNRVALRAPSFDLNDLCVAVNGTFNYRIVNLGIVSFMANVRTRAHLGLCVVNMLEHVNALCR